MTRLTRRAVLKLTAGACGALLVGARPYHDRDRLQLIRKAIPATGERIPVVGLGSLRAFGGNAEGAEAESRRSALRVFHELGGRVVDTAPWDGASESLIGQSLRDLDVLDDMFLATKVNVGGEDRGPAREQMAASSQRYGGRVVDLVQVWNVGGSAHGLGDGNLAMHMDVVGEWKAAGRTRYVGITTSFPAQYAAVERALNGYSLDFLQVDYSLAERSVERRLLPLAADRGVAVLVSRPFSSALMFSRLHGRPLPQWAADYDIESWSQFCLKFVVSHPAATCALPVASDPMQVRDNMAAARGRLPDAAVRRAMIEVLAAI
ncbi:aldo/keto reductase [soil metagenome]